MAAGSESAAPHPLHTSGARHSPQPKGCHSGTHARSYDSCPSVLRTGSPSAMGPVPCPSLHPALWPGAQLWHYRCVLNQQGKQRVADDARLPMPCRHEAMQPEEVYLIWMTPESAQASERSCFRKPQAQGTSRMKPESALLRYF